jgi:hypothetical protein
VVFDFLFGSIHRASCFTQSNWDGWEPMWDQLLGARASRVIGGSSSRRLSPGAELHRERTSKGAQR